MKTLAFLLLTATLSADPASDIIRARQINEWQHKIVPYVATPYVIQHPYYTLLHGGDCADKGALVVDLLAFEGITAQMAVLDVKGSGGHALIEIHGVYLDPVDGVFYLDWQDYPLIAKYAFNISSLALLIDWEKARKKVRR